MCRKLNPHSTLTVLDYPFEHSGEVITLLKNTGRCHATSVKQLKRGLMLVQAILTKRFTYPLTSTKPADQILGLDCLSMKHGVSGAVRTLQALEVA
jgi:hypothetical protein